MAYGSKNTAVICGTASVESLNVSSTSRCLRDAGCTPFTTNVLIMWLNRHWQVPLNCLRPQWPSGTLASYTGLAELCWNGTASLR